MASSSTLEGVIESLFIAHFYFLLSHSMYAIIVESLHAKETWEGVLPF